VTSKSEESRSEAAHVTEPDRYATTAPYYDATYAIVRGSDDVAFYRRLAVAAQGPVLELGVGTGRALLEIAALGIPVSGIDVSPAMLRVLRAKQPPPTVRLVQAPMQRFDLGEDRFCLIFSAFRAFQHLIEVEDQLSCLACVRRHLAPGGRFAFDVFAPRLDLIAQPGLPEREDARFESQGETIVRYASTRIFHAQQRIDVSLRYERRRVDGVILGQERSELSMRYFFRYELEHLLARAGFDDIQIYGGFDRRPYDHVSGETVCVARAR